MQYESRKLKDELEVQIRRHRAVVDTLSSEEWAANLLAQLAKAPSKERVIQETIKVTAAAAADRAEQEARAGQLVPDLPVPQTPLLQEARAMISTAAATRAEASKHAAVPASTPSKGAVDTAGRSASATAPAVVAVATTSSSTSSSSSSSGSGSSQLPATPSAAASTPTSNLVPPKRALF